MEQHYQKMIADTQERVVKSLQIQIKDKDDFRYGGFPETNGIVQAKFAIYRVASMVAAYCCKDTVYYRDREVYDSIMLGLSYVSSVQHENGLFDYITCNFYSAPDTAFCLKKLLPVYEYLLGKEQITGEKLYPEEENIKNALEKILKVGTEGLLEGGFHTPNHRWAIASMLLAGWKLFDREDMKEAAFGYLKEGIDCNEDGEFSEKSAGNYNRVNNDAMILIARMTGDDSYEESVLRNLRMMLTYIEPDSSIFTANSTRFDKDRLIFPKDYYLEYLQMGIKYQIPEFLQMSNRIFEIVQEKNITSPDFLIWFMLWPNLRSLEVTDTYCFPDYHAFYGQSQIARCKQGRYTYTVMGGKSNFFYFHNGTMKLEMKVCGSFCEHRSFISENMEQIAPGKYHLSQVMGGWYYLPFPEAPNTSDWWAMDNQNRPKKMGPDMHIDVWVTEVKNGVDVRVKTAGVEGAPWRLELAFSGVNFLTGKHLDMPLSGSEVLVVKEGNVEVTNGKDSLVVGPCFGTHHFTEGKEDSETKTPGCATLYLTDYTAFDHTVEIRNKRSFYDK